MYFVCNNEFDPVFYGTEQECREILNEATQRLIPEEVLRDHATNHTRMDQLVDSYNVDTILLK